MCLIAFSFRPDAARPLVLASNRDEFFQRPTKAAHWWPEHKGVYGGRDQSAGGTWLAIRKIPGCSGGASTNFRLVALTNYRDGQAGPAKAISRGAIVTDLLLSKDSVNGSLSELAGRLERYAGFNVIAFEWQLAAIRAGKNTTTGIRGLAGWHLSNRGRYRDRVCKIEPGDHALSNASFDESWPKSVRLKRAIESDTRQASLLAALTDATPVASQDLPDTGIDKAVEQLLATPFIRRTAEHERALDGYGTRSSSIVDLQADGLVQLNQWTWDTSRTDAVCTNQRQMVCQVPPRQAL